MPEEWRRNTELEEQGRCPNPNCGIYREIKLMSHTMRLWERIVEVRLRAEVNICEQKNVSCLEGAQIQCL